MKIVGGAADLEWNRRSAVESSGKRWSAAELDWIWVRSWFEYGFKENKLESGADEWIGWEEVPPIWGCECAGLWGFVGAPGSEGFVGCAVDVVSTIWGFCLERQTKQRANKVGR